MMTEATARVYKIPTTIREDFKAQRSTTGLTNQLFLEQCITDNLGSITDALVAMGFNRTTGKSRPARFFLNPELIDAMREASEKVGISAQQLLLLCIAHSCPAKTQVAKPAKTQEAKPTKKAAAKKPAAKPAKKRGK